LGFERYPINNTTHERAGTEALLSGPQQQAQVVFTGFMKRIGCTPSAEEVSTNGAADAPRRAKKALQNSTAERAELITRILRVRRVRRSI
jgi:hypothetical protein